MPDDITKDALTGESDVVSADGSKAVTESSLKDILSKELGKQFPNDETALKAVKDTFRYVGEMPKLKSAMQTLKQKLNTDDAGVIHMLEEQANQTQTEKVTSSPDELKALTSKVEKLDFYNQNPALKPVESLLEELHASTGKPRSEIVSNPTYKEMLEKVQAADEAKNRKSVLQSNSRLGQAGTKMDEARAALKAGNDTEARRSAVGAVIEAFEQS